MSKKSIEHNLTKALLGNGEMVQALYEHELKEHIEEFLESKQRDGNNYLFSVTENNNHVAMVLIDEVNNVHINEAARMVLQTYWRGSVYKSNMKKLIPQMTELLSAGNLFVTGVTVQ